jgi:hypothetical protein
MAEIIIIEILAAVGVLSLVFYLIFTGFMKNQKLHNANEKGREIMRIEKELDRTDSIKRGLHLLKIEEKTL